VYNKGFYAPPYPNLDPVKKDLQKIAELMALVEDLEKVGFDQIPHSLFSPFWHKPGNLHAICLTLPPL